MTSREGVNTSWAHARTGGGSTTPGVAVTTRTRHGDATRGIAPTDLAALFQDALETVVGRTGP